MIKRAILGLSALALVAGGAVNCKPKYVEQCKTSDSRSCEGWGYENRIGIQGVYDRATGVLSLKDKTTGETVKIDAESGGKPTGDPIPVGDYEILQHPDSDYFRLDAVDSDPRNDTHDGTGRTHFRLHKPGSTTGCIAAKVNEEWQKAKGLVHAARTYPVDAKSFSGRIKRLWSKYNQEVLNKYGNIRVIDSSQN